MSRCDNVPFNKPFFAGKELSYIAQAILANSHISGNGPFTKKCQDWIEWKLGARKVLLTHSCTAALEMSALLLGLGPGDEVIMPSFTFVSTANAFVLRGATPVFVDVRPDTMNLDEQLVAQAVTEKTRAVVPVHYAGVACEMDTILELATRHDLAVIEDAAQAFLSPYKDRFLGTLGTTGCISFHETKNIISGEGGALIINDPELTEKAEIIWEKGTNRGRFLQGQVDKYTWVDLGSSYLPSDILAAFLYAQLEMAEEIIATRCRLFGSYITGLRDLEAKGYIRLPVATDHCSGNGHIMYIVTGSLEERTQLTTFLKEKNINAIFHYVPLHSSPMGLKCCRANGELPVTNKISDCLLRLPLYYEMTELNVEKVSEAIYDFYNFR